MEIKIQHLQMIQDIINRMAFGGKYVILKV